MLATPTFEIEQLQASDRVTPSLETNSRTMVADRPRQADRVRQAKRRSRKVAAGGACLVISADGLKRMMFGQSADRCGWEQIVCEDMASALEHLDSGNVGMVLIDTASTGGASVDACRWLVERLAENKQVLTVVCGRTSDSQEEVWARECGVWMYLPGVAPESDLDPMLLAGREISARMHSRRAVAA